MSEDFSNIPSDLVTTAEAARILKEHGDKTSAQNLRKYCKRHDLIEKTVGKFLMVNPQRVAKFRAENFTTEVMRGTHAKDTNVVQLPTKNKRAKKNKTATTSNQNISGSVEDPTSLDRARDAKATREEAHAEKLLIELEQLKGNLVAVSAVEAGGAATVSTLKKALLGPRLGDHTDRLLATLNLKDDKKRAAKSILKSIFIEALTDVDAALIENIDRLNSTHAKGRPSRMEKLVTRADQLLKQSRTSSCGEKLA